MSTTDSRERKRYADFSNVDGLEDPKAKLIVERLLQKALNRQTHYDRLYSDHRAAQIELTRRLTELRHSIYRADSKFTKTLSYFNVPVSPWRHWGLNTWRIVSHKHYFIATTYCELVNAYRYVYGHPQVIIAEKKKIVNVLSYWLAQYNEYAKVPFSSDIRLLQAYQLESYFDMGSISYSRVVDQFHLSLS